MDDDRSVERQQAQYARDDEYIRRIQQEVVERHHVVSPQFSYQMKLGRVVVKLQPVEFRILRFPSLIERSPRSESPRRSARNDIR